MAYLNYFLFRGINFLIGLMPFGLIHLFSNLVAFFLHRVFKYRLPVIKRNLEFIKPNASEAERASIISQFYGNLADLFLESIKGNSMSAKQILRRYVYKNPDLIEAVYAKHQSIILAPGHYNNWEWAAVTLSYISDFKLVAMYKQLSNSYIDSYIRRNRSRKGFLMVPLHETNKTFKDHQGIKTMFGLVGDQSPSSIKKAIWIKFFDQDTACLHGIESYSSSNNYPILFAFPKRVGRSRYEIEFEILIEEPQNYSKGEITKIYMKRLETLIRKDPENWILSHKRWKHKLDGSKVTR